MTEQAASVGGLVVPQRNGRSELNYGDRITMPVTKFGKSTISGIAPAER